ncbi:MAG: hypothetical protein R2797_08505 [Gelidibacter sp.]
MKNSLVLLLCFTTLSCIKYDGKIPNEYRKPFSHYKTNQIIYFRSNLNDYDTLKIEKIDSFISKSNGLYHLPSKKIFLSVSYCLKNYNKENIFLYKRLQSKTTRKFDSIANLEFITLNKEQSSEEDNYSVHIRYRNFSGYLNIEKTTDTINNVLSGKTYSGENVATFKSDWVTRIYWSQNKGMIGYEKEDGQIYQLFEKE